ncbi:MAG: SRPBCC family protein [Dehalococcoidia bacterium]
MARANTNKVEVRLPSDREIQVTRVFEAPRDLVWRAYTEVDMVAKWWGRGNPLDIERFEVEPGGHWRFVETHGGGSDGFEGRFGEVVAPERLVQTFEWDGMPAHVALNTATFEDLGNGTTKLMATSLFHTAADRDGMLQSGMEEGMSQSYAALDELLGSLLR